MKFKQNRPNGLFQMRRCLSNIVDRRITVAHQFSQKKKKRVLHFLETDSPESKNCTEFE